MPLLQFNVSQSASTIAIWGVLAALLQATTQSDQGTRNRLKVALDEQVFHLEGQVRREKPSDIKEAVSLLKDVQKAFSLSDIPPKTP